MKNEPITGSFARQSRIEFTTDVIQALIVAQHPFDSVGAADEIVLDAEEIPVDVVFALVVDAVVPPVTDVVAVAEVGVVVVTIFTKPPLKVVENFYVNN